MNKTAIKNFAIAARQKLISEITYKAGLVGITKDSIAEPVHKAEGIEMYDIGANQPYTIKGEEIKQRKSLATRVKEKGFDQVVEEVAYTWFNRIIAVRFMEVNDYLPTRVRVLSSEPNGKSEPDIVTEAPNVDLDFRTNEIDEILQLKHDNKLDELFRMLFIKQCNTLHEILPDLFEKTADYTELLLQISFTNEDGIIRELIQNIDEEDFKEQVEIIGWLYQYYNTELKDDTFAKLKANIKITKERIPAATQLFTPDWIVRYMVENSLGRLWLEGHPDSDIQKKWKYYLEEAEQEPDVKAELEKLRAERKNIKPKDIKIIDPCMGSGHILVYAFDVLMDIYKSCGYAEREAAKLILENNLYGLDIDDRAYQLAYFAVMMKARGYSRRILNEGIRPQLCAIQESNNIECRIKNVELRETVRYLLDVFQDAKEYGSILNVECSIEKLELLAEYIASLDEFAEDLFEREQVRTMREQILPLVRQALIMSRKYDMVVTNPPYMGNGGMGEKLTEFVKKNYPDTKSDLSTVFMDKTLDMCHQTGIMAMINIPVWMFLSSYERLRENLIKHKTFINMLHFGRGVFGSDFGTTAFVIGSYDVKNYMAGYRKLYQKQGAVDSLEKKEQWFFDGTGNHIASKERFSSIPGMPIAYWLSDALLATFKHDTLRELTISDGQTKTGNNNKYLRSVWEVNSNGVGKSKKWVFHAKGGPYRRWYGNIDNVIDWSVEARDHYRKDHVARIAPEYIWFRKGVCWNLITISERFAVRILEDDSTFNLAAPSLFLIDTTLTEYVLGLLNTIVSEKIIRMLNPTVNTNIGDVIAFPVIISKEHKLRIDNLVEENINISRIDWNSFETSWGFEQHPLLLLPFMNEDGSKVDKEDTFSGITIKKSFTIWDAITENQFAHIKANEEELNRIFIEIYGLQDELSPEVDDKDITIRKADLERDIKSFISYAVGCMLGRYSLDVDGLVYAGGDWDSSKYQTFLPDVDNVLPITDEEYFTDDIVGRFVEFVKVTFGAETLEENLDYIAKALGNKGNTSREIIRNYFIKDFYKDHVKIYQKKPIYWLFDSGKENGFKALIYMHRYHPDTVGRVRADYLHKTQKAIENAIARADMVIESTANPTHKAKAVKDKEKLVKQLAETRIYDAAIGHIAAQRIDIDLDDGVTVNYAKFQGVEISSEGKKTSKIDLLGKI